MTEKTQPTTEEEKNDLPVLFTFGGPTQVALWEPLGEHFRLAFYNTTMANMAGEMGIKVGAIGALIDPETEEFAKNQAMWLTSDVMHGLTGDISKLDPDEPKLRAPELGNWLPSFIYERMTAALVQALAASYLHEDTPIVGILLHEDVTPEARVFAQWGAAEGIPVLHIPHANHFISPGTKDIHCSTTAQHIGVAGEHMRRWYKTCGVEGTRITVLGAPQWDWLYDDEKLPSHEHARRALGFDQDDIIVAYATTWHQDTNVWGAGASDHDAAFQEMLVAMLKLDTYTKKDCRLIVKMHPGEAGDREKYYEYWMREAGVRGCITRVQNEFMLTAADVLVTQGSSNIAIESNLLGTPVVEHYQCGTKYPDEYGIPGTWGPELAEMIGDTIGKGKNEAFIKDMNYDDDGGAVERCVQWVRELCPTK